MNFAQFLEQIYGVKPKQPDQFGDWLGYEIQSVDRNKNEVTTALTVRADHLSPSGAVHGGVISGFLDFSCGCAVFSTVEKHELCSTVELNVKYFKPLKKGHKLMANARVVNRGKTLCSVLAELYLTDDIKHPVAMATGTFNIYERKS